MHMKSFELVLELLFDFKLIFHICMIAIRVPLTLRIMHYSMTFDHMIKLEIFYWERIYKNIVYL